MTAIPPCTNLPLRQKPNKGAQTVLIARSFGEYCQAGPTGQLGGGEQNTLTVFKKNPHYQLVTILGAEISVFSHTVSLTLSTVLNVLLFPIALYTQNGGFRAINASPAPPTVAHASIATQFGPLTKTRSVA